MVSIRTALNSLLSVCDGARKEDFKGFNAIDARVARRCGRLPTWTHKRELHIHEMLLKYKVQLAGRFDIDYEALEFETTEADVDPHDATDDDFGKPFVVYENGKLVLLSNYDYKEFAKSIPYCRWYPDIKCWACTVRKESLLAFGQYILTGKVLAGDDRVLTMIEDANQGKYDHVEVPKVEKAVLIFKDGKLTLRSPYEFREKAKNIPTSRWDPQNKYWTYLPVKDALMAFEPFIKSGEVDAGPEISAMIDKAKLERLELIYSKGKLILKSPFTFKDNAKAIPGHTWDKDARCWTYKPAADTLLAFEPYITSGEMVADGKIKDMIADVYAAQAQKAAARDVKSIDVTNVKMPIKTEVNGVHIEPYKHQLQTFVFAMERRAVAFFHEQGTGKTMCAIGVSGQHYLDGHVKKCLVVAPLTVLPNWLNEYRDYADFPYNVKILNGKSPAKRREKLLAMNNPDCIQVCVINYDLIRNKDIQDAIKEWAPDMSILDESQKIKDGTTQQSKACHEMGLITPYKILMTGTPISQGEWDVFSQYLYLDPTVYGSDWRMFKETWCEMGGYEDRQILAIKNKLDFHDKMYSIAIRFTKAECLDLPPEVFEAMYCELKESKQYYDLIHADIERLYNEMGAAKAKEIAARRAAGEDVEDVDTNRGKILNEILRLHQCSGGFYKGYGKKELELVGHEKLNLLKDILGDMPLKKKLVIFANFRPEIDAIEALVKSTGRTVGVLCGDTPMKARGKLNDDFQKTPDPAVIIVQTQTGNMGINLHAADTMIFYSMDYSYMNWSQAMARIQRSGQTADKVTFLFLLAKGTVDETIYKALQRKESVASLMVDRLRLGDIPEELLTEDEAHAEDVPAPGVPEEPVRQPETITDYLNIMEKEQQNKGGN